MGPLEGLLCRGPVGFWIWSAAGGNPLDGSLGGVSLEFVTCLGVPSKGFPGGFPCWGPMQGLP